MMNIRSLIVVSMFPLLMAAVNSYAAKIEPPWGKPPTGGINFTVAGIDNVPDLHGDIINPNLVVFFAGNQFMVIPDLLEAFKKKYPQYQKIYVETLPPGILAKQLAEGSLIIGNLKITVKPDVFTAGEARIKEMQGKQNPFEKTAAYAHNRLAIMVYRGNPKKIKSLKDLGRKDVRVSMPNPAWEGVGNRIIEAYRKAGGKELEDKIMVQKVKTGTTFLTQIHHRQTPVRVMLLQSDVGPVWYTEAFFQEMIQNPISLVEIPEKDNVTATYVAGKLKGAPHQQAAEDFFNFLTSPEGQAVYKKYNFLPVEEKAR